MMTINIATLGSFITNDNFNTSYNPYYKQFFNVLAQIQKPLVEHNEKEALFKQLKDKTPHYFVIDFSLDILHCWRQSNQSFNDYFEEWKKSVQQLIHFLTNELPNCRIILIQGRFVDTFRDGTTMVDYCEQQGLSPLNMTEMNVQWHALNKYFAEQLDVEVLDVTQANYRLDKINMTALDDFHYEKRFYNHFLNKLISLIYENKVMDITQEKTIQKIYLNDDYELLQTKQVEVVIGSDTNLIQLARKNDKAYQLYKNLLKNDYVLYFHKDGISKLYKRRFVDELWQRKDLNKVGDIFYTLDCPKDRKDNESIPDKKLIVVFSCMPGSDTYDSHLIGDRMFKKLFDGIERSLVKNVYTMRIMDLNLSHGSHFINSVNYQSMSQDISDAIVEVKEKLNLQDDDIVLYGVSKGGTGALYYGAKLDLKCLAVDPIINLGEYNRKDVHFLRDLRQVDVSDDINAFLSHGSHYEKYIIGSENVAFNYEHICKITGANVVKINKKDNHIKTHPDVSPNTIPEQLMLLNKMLLDMKFMMVNI